MFDFFVKETYWIYKILNEYLWLFTFFYFTTSAAAFSIFVFHENVLMEMDFFMKYVELFYDFNKTHYLFNRAMYCTILPLAMWIIIKSLLEGFNSVKFLQRYG